MLASCCLTPASEGVDAGPCADCTPPDGGVRCSSDADCPGGYCALGLSSCPGATVPLATVVPGYCHRDCQNSACVCQDAADCPLSAATGNANPCGPGGQCAAFGADCANVTCPAACPPTQPLESLCPVCVCAACPTPDAGNASGCDGTASLSGGCGNAAPFTVVTAASFLGAGIADIVLSSAQNCQSTFPSSISFDAVVIDLGSAAGVTGPGTYPVGAPTNGGGPSAGGGYTSWLTDGQGNSGGGGAPATGGTVTVDSVNLDAGTIAGSFTLDFGPTCALSGTFSTEPSSCCQ